MSVTADFSGAKDSRSVDGTASRQWASRPDDERYISMQDADDYLTDRRLRCTESVIKLAEIMPTYDSGNLQFKLPDIDRPVDVTHYAFSDLCTRIKAPATYLRRLPNKLAADCMAHGFDPVSLGNEEAKVLIEWDKGPKLRSVTGPNYGRIWDNQLSGAIRALADQHGWEVPIAFHHPGLSYNPVVAADVNKANTTIYAGDRDCFFFLVDQKNPIEAGKTANGDPRMFFRGIYSWNSEVGDKTIGIGTFLYEYVCMNRNIWGQAGFESFVKRHTRLAPDAFVKEITPALEAFMSGSATGIEAGLLEAQKAMLPKDETDKFAYLHELFGLSKIDTQAVIDSVLAEEGHPMLTAFDAVQGVTAFARSIPFAADRVELEKKAGTFLAQFATA